LVPENPVTGVAVGAGFVDIVGHPHLATALAAGAAAATILVLFFLHGGIPTGAEEVVEGVFDSPSAALFLRQLIALEEPQQGVEPVTGSLLTEEGVVGVREEEAAEVEVRIVDATRNRDFGHAR